MTDFIQAAVAPNPAQAEMGFPLESKATLEIEGITTEILCTSFDNRIFVVITQINKFGTFLNAWAEPKADGGKLYMINTLLGKRDDPLLTIYARQMIERLSVYTAKPILLAISLKDEGRSREQFQAILNKFFEIAVW